MTHDLANELTPRQFRAIKALVTEPTLEAAAAESGISRSTLYRWLRNERFETAYRDERRRCTEMAVADLQRAAGEAVETLRRNLNCERPSVEISAAIAVLDRAFRGEELYDMFERIEMLEEALDLEEG